MTAVIATLLYVLYTGCKPTGSPGERYERKDGICREGGNVMLLDY